MTEEEQRATVVSTAKGWLRTPYHHLGMTRAGVDCATLILICAKAAGIVPADETLPFYSFQWNQNGSNESLVDFIKRFCPEFDGPPLPASLVVWQLGRTYCHGAIVIDWPLCIHARVGAGVEWVNAETDGTLALSGTEPRPKKFFDHWIA